MNDVDVDLSKIDLEWGYEGTCDSSKWSIKYPSASGSHQSPIDLIIDQAYFDNFLNEEPLVFYYNSDCFRALLNTGSSFKVSGSENARSNVYGGPLKENHTFLQFHMHWGINGSVGSEHLINGKAYAGELHFVNWNSDRYECISDALNSNDHDGLCVLGVLVDVGNENTEFEKLIKGFDEIRLRDQSKSLNFDLDITKLFPSDLSSYFTYDGSLTTPPCTECVKWIVYKEPIEISNEQLNKLHDLYKCKEECLCCDKHRINQNYRPICELNDRMVRKSFA